MSWIHLADLVEIIMVALRSEGLSGAINGVAPNPVVNKEFTRTLAGVLGRPALFPVPPLGLRALYGGGAAAILSSQRVRPSWANEAGFVFRFEDLESALRDILETQGLEIIPIDSSTPAPMSGGGYLERRRPRYMLRTRTRLKVSVDNLWPFFSAAGNLGLITPPDMGFRVTRPPEEMRDGTIIEYRIQVGGLPMSWRTQIECWRPGVCFVDSQTAGPYRSWWHEHHFEPDGEDTVMEDRVYYNPPMGLLGRIANWLFIQWELRRIFGYRADRIRFRFGD
jgi:hypothetical protein